MPNIVSAAEAVRRTGRTHTTSVVDLDAYTTVPAPDALTLPQVTLGDRGVF